MTHSITTEELDRVDECMDMLFTDINLIVPNEVLIGPVGLQSQMKVKEAAKEDYRKLSDAISALRKHSDERTESHYTWEEKIESLVKLARAAGRFINTDRGTEGYKVTREHLIYAYDEFCEWRHEEPYVVDEIKALLGKK